MWTHWRNPFRETNGTTVHTTRFGGFTLDQFLSGPLLPGTAISFTVFIAHEALLGHTFCVVSSKKDAVHAVAGCIIAWAKYSTQAWLEQERWPTINHTVHQSMHKLSIAVAFLLFLHVHHVPVTSFSMCISLNPTEDLFSHLRPLSGTENIWQCMSCWWCFVLKLLSISLLILKEEKSDSATSDQRSRSPGTGLFGFFPK